MSKQVHEPKPEETIPPVQEQTLEAPPLPGPGNPSPKPPGNE